MQRPEYCVILDTCAVPLGLAVMAAAQSTNILNATRFTNLRSESLATLPYNIGTGTSRIHKIKFPWGQLSKDFYHIKIVFAKIIKANCNDLMVGCLPLTVGCLPLTVGCLPLTVVCNC